MSSRWGIKCFGVVEFDVDKGQKLEYLYPPDIPLIDDCKLTIACLSLPHTTGSFEGDLQYTFRFRTDFSYPLDSKPDHHPYLYGFVLFRQRRDDLRERGFYQKSIVLIAEFPFVNLFETIMRIVGPLYFSTGDNILGAVYDNVQNWSFPIPGKDFSLFITGKHIQYLVPHELLSSEWYQLLCSSEVDYREGNRSDRQSNTSQCSFQTENIFAYQFLNLQACFTGVEHLLLELWGIAITGESIIIMAPNARLCSQAVLAFTSLISPLPFKGDYRPYFTIFEKDFNEVSRWNNSGTIRYSTVIGTTNPFFLKSCSKWPNFLILSDDKDASTKSKFQMLKFKDVKDLGSLWKREPVLVSRRNPLCRTSIQFLSILESKDEQINKGLVLREYFLDLTRKFLRPFDQYFGSWFKDDSINVNPYVHSASLLKPFDKNSFLQELEQCVPHVIRGWNWREMYQGFMSSPSFKNWFENKRLERMKKIELLLKSIRMNIQDDGLIRSPQGKILSDSTRLSMYHNISRAILQEERNNKPDECYLEKMKSHLRTVKMSIPGRDD